MSGQLGGKYSHDVLINIPVLNTDRPFECKRRARKFSTIYTFLGQAYGLIIRDDKTKPLVVLRLEDFIALAKGVTKPVTVGASWHPPEKEAA
jgi:hypothetical protein